MMNFLIYFFAFHLLLLISCYQFIIILIKIYPFFNINQLFHYLIFEDLISRFDTFLQFIFIIFLFISLIYHFLTLIVYFLTITFKFFHFKNCYAFAIQDYISKAYLIFQTLSFL